MSFLKKKISLDELLSDDEDMSSSPPPQDVKVKRGDTSEDELIKKIKQMNVKSNVVRFTHSIYGIIRSGEYKGREVEIREYYPGKVEALVDKKGYISIGKKMNIGDKIMGCEVVSEVKKLKDNIYKYLINCKKSVLFPKNSVKIEKGMVKILKGKMKGLTGKLLKVYKARLLVTFDAGGSRIMKFMNMEDIFYTDLLLNSDNYFNIDKVEKIGDKYQIFGRERVIGKPDIQKMIGLSDIKKYMPGVSLEGSKKVEEMLKDEVEYVSEEIDRDNEIIEDDMEDGSEMDYESETEDVLEEEPDMVKLYKDIERTEIITQQLSSIERDYYNIIKNILDISGESIDNINPYDIINTIEMIVGKMNKLISDNKINFDISGSKIDMRMLIALLVAYEMQRSGLIFESFKIYITDLFNKNYFYSKVDDLMVSFFLRKDNVLFKCDLKRLRDSYKSKKYYNIVEELMLCLDGILKKMLNIPVSLKMDKMDTGLLLEKVEPIVKEHKRFITFEDIINDDISKDARKIVWSPLYEGVVNEFKKALNESIRLITGEMKMEINEKSLVVMEEKVELYKYVLENLDMAPMALNWLAKVFMNVLVNRFEDFEGEYMECGMNELMCKDSVIKVYVDKFFGDTKGKSKMISDVEYLAMKRYNELSRIFGRLVERLNEKIRKPKKEKIQKELEEKKVEKEKLLKKRKEIIKDMVEDEEILEGLEKITLDSDLIGLRKKRR